MFNRTFPSLTNQRNGCLEFMCQHQVCIVERFLQQNQIKVLIIAVNEFLDFFIFKAMNVGFFHKHHTDNVRDKWGL